MKRLLDWYRNLTPNQMLVGVLALLLIFNIARHALFGGLDKQNCHIDWDGYSNTEVCD